MSHRIDELIESLNLEKHPEGGYFREVYRSQDLVVPRDDRSERPAMTSIYFMLGRGDRSRWHVVQSDEVWHFYEGDTLELLVIDPDSMALDRKLLGPVKGDVHSVQIVPAGHWQAARSLGEYTLVGCTVGPGFVFDDFGLIADRQEAAAKLRVRHPDLVDYL